MISIPLLHVFFRKARSAGKKTKARSCAEIRHMNSTMNRVLTLRIRLGHYKELSRNY